MRGERTESSFAAIDLGSAAAAGPGTGRGRAASIGHMSDLGLRYGEEFRPIRELVGGRRQIGRPGVACPRRSRTAPANTRCIPVLFDGALQVFSAGAATVEDRRSQMKLPVRFARILFLRSPGASAACAPGAAVQRRIHRRPTSRSTTRPASPACSSMASARSASPASAAPARPGGTRDLLYHVDWERTPSTIAPAPRPPLPLAQLRDAAAHALEEVIAMRGRARTRSRDGRRATISPPRSSRAACARWASTPAKRFTADSLRRRRADAAGLRAPDDQSRASAACWQQDGDGYTPTAAFATRGGLGARKRCAPSSRQHPGHLPEASALRGHIALNSARFCAAKRTPCRSSSRGAGAELLDQFYGDGLFTSHWMASIAAAVQEAARHLPEGRGLRILEIGAGTGGLAAHVLPLLERGLHSYTFTDVSAGFFPGGDAKAGRLPRSRMQDFRSRKIRRRTGLRSRTRSTSSSAPTCCTP